MVTVMLRLPAVTAVLAMACRNRWAT